MSKPNLKALYLISKSAKVGEECKCPTCSTLFIKTNQQQAFCKSKSGTYCKDWYWNNVTQNKRNNITRISPANASYYHNVIEPKQIEKEFYDDDQGWDSHKDSFL